MGENLFLLSDTSIEVKCDDRYAPSSISPTYFAMVFKDFPDGYVLSEDFENWGFVVGAAHLVMLLTSHEFKLPFEKVCRFKKPRLNIGKLGFRIISFLDNDIHRLTLAYAHHRLTSTIEALLEVAKKFDPKIPPSELKLIGDAYIDDAVTEYNELALKMRQALLAEGMGERVKSFRRNATRNYRHLMQVIRSSHERKRKILLIRLDWSEKNRDPTLPIEYLSQGDFDVAAVRVGKARDQMVRHLKDRYKDDLLFYAWKIEWGVQAGFHIHWLIGLNGSVHQDRINVPFHIGKEWDQDLFKGTSHTHNINAMPGKDRAGLCVLHYADSQAGYFFGLYADYLTKVDYNLKLRLPKGMRSFGCSKLNQQSKGKTGPTRSYQMPDYDFAEVRGRRGRPTGRRFAAKPVSKGLA